MILKHHFLRNGKTHYFQRQYPKKLHDWCKASSRSITYKKRLEIDSNASQAQVAAALEIQNEIFDEFVSVVTAGNIPKLSQLELRKKADAWLEHHNLAAGLFNAKVTDKDLQRNTTLERDYVSQAA